MKKRRRLAEKLKVAMCLLSVIVSTLFYAPMSVEASETNVLTLSPSLVSADSRYSKDESIPPNGGRSVIEKQVADSGVLFNFGSHLKSGSGLYKVTFDLTAVYSCQTRGYWRNVITALNTFNAELRVQMTAQAEDSNVCRKTESFTLYMYDNAPTVGLYYGFILLYPYDMTQPQQIHCDWNISNIKAQKVSLSDAEQYNKGYQTGLAEGQQQGYNSGYSDGFAKGEQSGYDKGFQAGVNSVDTNSIYEAGKKAGYNAGYKAGYDNGHKAGYDEAMSRIESWGADTTKYPVLVHSSSPNSSTYDKHIRFFGNRGDNFQSEFSILVWSLPIGSGGTDQIDPNHLYKFVVDTPLFELVESDVTNTGYLNYSLYFCVGGNEYQISDTARSYDSANAASSWLDIFIPGSELSTSAFLKFKFDPMSIRGDSGGTFVDIQIKSSYVSGSGYDLYDYGPVNNTQNQIANQTDQLVNGFDNSAGNASHNKFQGSVNEYETAENSLFATATDNIAKFQFFDFQSISAVMTGITFITSTMTKIFNLSGGISGVGIILSVLFSVMLVSMALGLYKRYQSTGHGSSGTGNTDKSDKGGGK